MDLQAVLFLYKHSAPFELIFKVYSRETWVVEVIQDADFESEGREAWYQDPVTNTT